jgi:hypothetical protein
MEERREYLLESASDWPFPEVRIDGRPDPWQLSQALFEHFELACEVVGTQATIGVAHAQRAEQEQPDIVALMVVDGLSYYDLPEAADIQPCLVAGPSITDFGYREVFGKPPVSQRLYALGYTHQIGFTYFAPENNEIAADLFKLFSESQVRNITSFHDVFHDLSRNMPARAFIQLTAPGLDGICHEHRDRPPKEVYLQQSQQRLDTLVDVLQSRRRQVLACLTADHGILWRDVLESPAYIISDLPDRDGVSAKYVIRCPVTHLCEGHTSWRRTVVALPRPHADAPLADQRVGGCMAESQPGNRSSR